MTDEQRTHDSIDESTTRQADDAAPNDGEGASGDDSGRGILATAAGTILGAAGLGALTGTASASRNDKRLLVVSDAAGRHEYEVRMEHGSTIRNHTHADGNDSYFVDPNKPDLRGEVRNYNVDSYLYQGQVKSVQADGPLAFHFLDGGFTESFHLQVDGQDSGRHEYVIDTNSGDIDLHTRLTEDGDSDERGSDSEQSDTVDTVSGFVYNNYTDKFVKGYDHPVRRIRISQGKLRVSR